MTVHELIETLSSLPQDVQVVTYEDDGNYYRITKCKVEVMHRNISVDSDTTSYDACYPSNDCCMCDDKIPTETVVNLTVSW